MVKSKRSAAAIANANKKRTTKGKLKPGPVLGQDLAAGVPAVLHRLLVEKGPLNIWAVDIGSVRSGFAFVRAYASDHRSGFDAAAETKILTYTRPYAFAVENKSTLKDPIEKARAMRLATRKALRINLSSEIVGVNSTAPDIILFETPGGAGNFGGGRGLITLGIAVGAMLSEFDSYPGLTHPPIPVQVGTWSRLYGGRAMTKPDRAEITLKAGLRVLDHLTPPRALDDAVDAGGMLLWALGLIVNPKGISTVAERSGLVRYLP